MATTLDAIETALFTALDTKRQTAGAALTTTRPFRSVARWSAEGRPEDVAEAAAGVCPSALLVYLGSDAVTGRGGDDYVETLGHDGEVVEDHLFGVYVTVADTRGDVATVKGGTNLPGILACSHAVADALAGLRVSGLKDGGVVHLVRRRPLARTAAGATHVIYFRARATLAATTETLPGAALSRVDTTVNDATPDVDTETVTLAVERTPIT